MKKGGLTAAVLISVLLHAVVGSAVLWKNSTSQSAAAPAGEEPIAVELVLNEAEFPADAPTGMAPQPLEDGPPPTPVTLNIGTPDTLEGSDATGVDAPNATDAQSAAPETAAEPTVPPSTAAAPSPQADPQSVPSADAAPPTAADKVQAASAAEGDRAAENEAATAAPQRLAISDLENTDTPTPSPADTAQTQASKARREQTDAIANAALAREAQSTAPWDSVDASTGEAPDPQEDPAETPPPAQAADQLQPDEATDATDAAEPPRETEGAPVSSDPPAEIARALPTPKPQRAAPRDTAPQPDEPRNETAAVEQQLALNEALRSAIALGLWNTEGAVGIGGAEAAKVAYTEAVRSAIAPRFWNAMRDVQGVGQTVIEVVIRRDGSLQSAKIFDGSGNTALDTASLHAARSTSFPALPQDVDSDTLTVHIPLRAR